MRFHSEEEYLAAVQDAAYDRFLETAVRCRECGTRYDRATVRPRAASQPGASAKSAPTAVQPRSRSNEMTGCARTDYLHADDAELSPTRSITIAVQVAGRSGGDASEAIVTAMKGPRRGTTKASALVAAVLASHTGRLRAADQQHEHEHEHDPAHRIGLLDEQHRFGRYARSLDDGPDPRPAQLRCRPEERTSSRLLHRLSPDRAAATRFRVLPRDRRGPLLTPGSALHSRRAQPGRHPGQHPPDDLPRGLDRHDTAARERHRARESREHDRLRRRRADQLLRI